MICINCGYNNKDDAKFCIKCGSKIMPLSGTGSFGGAAEGSGKIYCTYCGTENRSSYRFCKHCGKELFKKPAANQNVWGSYNVPAANQNAWGSYNAPVGNESAGEIYSDPSGEESSPGGYSEESFAPDQEDFSRHSSSNEMSAEEKIFRQLGDDSGVQKGDLLLGEEEELTVMIQTPQEGEGSEGGPHLRLSSLADVGTTYEAELSGPVKIGRSNLRNNQIILSDPSVSREHCVVAFRDGVLYVKDLESVNHTYVNEKEVTGETSLPEGSTLRLGNSAFLVDIVAE